MAFATLLWAARRLARACSSAAWNSCGSIFAMTWPFFTGELKSTLISRSRPETWLPTWTVTSADSVPVAVTLATMRPRSTFTVSKRMSGCWWAAR